VLVDSDRCISTATGQNALSKTLYAVWRVNSLLSLWPLLVLSQ
jgi:hypothetical protein